MTLPTNEDLHSSYSQLYKLFSKNTDLLNSTLHLFSSKEDTSYADYKKNLKLFEQDYDLINYYLRDIKVNLFRIMNSFQSGRLLEDIENQDQQNTDKQENNQEKQENKPENKQENNQDKQNMTEIKKFSEREIFTFQNQAQMIIEILNLINNIKIKQESLRKYLLSIQSHNQNIGSIYDQILQNTSKIYKNNLKMINLYGDFYQIYQKIWSFFQQILKENQLYLDFITKELATEHYESIKIKAENLILNQFNYLTGNQIQNMQEIILNYSDKSFLDCQIKAQVDPGTIRVNTKFDLKLIVNNEMNDQFLKQSFDYGSVKQTYINISQLIDLPPGYNIL